MKKCKPCGTIDPLAFHASQTYICKPCKNSRDNAYRLADPEKNAARKKKWRDNNKGLTNANTAKRKACKLQQTPSWSETEEIAELYSWAAHLQKVTGIQMHVDHVVPLQGKHVSGLHCVDNLKVITAKENLTKGNKHASD